jgi:hypothetical protein
VVCLIGVQRAVSLWHQQNYMQRLFGLRDTLARCLLTVPTSGGEREQPCCMDSQEAAAAVHESAVALSVCQTAVISPALSHSTGILLPHGQFSGAVSNVWLHSFVAVTWRQLLLSVAQALLTQLHLVLAREHPSDLLTTDPWKSYCSELVW